MKYIITIVLAGMLASGKAQAIGIYVLGTPTDVSGTIVDLAGGEETHEDFDIVNLSVSTQILSVKRAKLQTVEGASDYLCWGKSATDGQCYPAETVGPNDPWTSPHSYTWAPSDTGLLSVYHLAQGNPGVAMYRYYVLDDMGDALDSVDVRFTSTVGIEAPAEAKISSYPNPAKDFLIVELSSNSNSDDFRIELYNVMGELLLTQVVVQGKNQVGLSGFTPGVYFFAVRENGKTIKTEKIIIK